jgi:DNA-binding beta-propeller fold protein YncE
MHSWIDVPASVQLANCHGVQESADGRIFIHHTGTPSMLVVDPDGKVIKTWGAEYAGGAHGLQIRKEGNEEFLYLALTGQHRVVKTDLDGKVVYELRFPKEADVYKDKEGNPSEGKYVPTNIAFAPNGDFYVADGYGSNYIHRYNIKGEYQNTFAGTGTEAGKTKCPHGIWCDTRGGDAKLIVADRGNNRLQYFDLDGKHLSFIQGKDDDGIVRKPCHFHEQKGDILIPDLRGRITILDKDNKEVAQLFDNVDPNKREKNGLPKAEWVDGQFITPHGAIWDSKGNIIVCEWIAPGRITKLRRIA